MHGRMQLLLVSCLPKKIHAQGEHELARHEETSKPEETDAKAEDGCKAQGEQPAGNDAEAKAGNAPEAEGADEFAAAEAAAENLICVPQIS